MKKIAVLAAAVFFSAQSGIPALNHFSANGYFKNFSILFMLPTYMQGGSIIRDPDMAASSNRFRLKLGFRPASFLSLEIAYDISPVVQDARLFSRSVLFGGMQAIEYRATDFRERICPGPGKTAASFGLFHNLDRFFLTVKTRRADIYVGRQVIAWGSGRVINPTDVLAPFSFNELDKEERRGIDAIRVRIPLGKMDEIDAGFVAGKNLNSGLNAFYLRGKGYRWKTDFSFLLLGFRRHLLVGMDIARALGGAGFWLEAALVFPHRAAGSQKEKNYFRSSTGVDYNLSGRLYGFFEYHFNSAGRSSPGNHLDLMKKSAYRDGSVYFIGKHYLNLGATYQLSPLIPFTGLLIFNLNDASFILAPSLEYNIAENIYLAGGAYLGIGKRAEHILGPLVPLPLRLKSEFGAYPDMVFTSFRVYF